MVSTEEQVEGTIKGIMEGTMFDGDGAKQDPTQRAATAPATPAESAPAPARGKRRRPSGAGKKATPARGGKDPVPKAAKDNDPDDGKGAKGSRLVRSFPACTFEEAMEIADGIQKFAQGHTIRRLTLFDELKKSAESSSSRQAITNSGRYGLTTGSYQAEHLSLTPDGKVATDPDSPPAENRHTWAATKVEAIVRVGKRVPRPLPLPTTGRPTLRSSTGSPAR